MTRSADHLLRFVGLRRGIHGGCLNDPERHAVKIRDLNSAAIVEGDGGQARTGMIEALLGSVTTSRGYSNGQP